MHDGHEIRSIYLPQSSNAKSALARISGLWWLKGPISGTQENSFPDLFKREGTVVSCLLILATPRVLSVSLARVRSFYPSHATSSRSISRSRSIDVNVSPCFLFLCHNDLRPNDTNTSSGRAAQLFSIGAPTSAAPKPVVIPQSVLLFPSLPTDLIAASISPPLPAGVSLQSQKKQKTKTKDVPNASNLGSILIATDDDGNMYPLLDGSYSLGTILLRHGGATVSVSGVPTEPTFFFHMNLPPSKAYTRLAVDRTTNLLPASLSLPLLMKGETRTVARVSSAMRELLAYVLKVMENMKTSWMGSETKPGASRTGEKWIEVLKERETVHDSAPLLPPRHFDPFD